MTKSSYPLIWLLLPILSGCAAIEQLLNPDASSTPALTFTQLKATPESFQGQPVIFGGKVLSARRLKDGTRIEILQLPLSSSLQPMLDLSKSQGRFIAMQKEFLDPATIPAGTFLTVTGEVAGSVILPLDETEYTYPMVEIKKLRVWPKDEDTVPRFRPPMAPGYYWGPYWSPYWRPWPYW